MKYKIMIAGDLHKRMKDITTIRGYIHGCRAVQLDLMKAIKEQGITHFISLGDWFDSGYGSDVSAALTHTDIDRQMYELLNGNFYGLIGNHIRLRMDSNPELFLIQPHSKYKSRHEVTRQFQIIRTPDVLKLNGVAIYLMHWNPMYEDVYQYKPMLEKDCHYHLALFHTEKIIPHDKMFEVGYSDEVSDMTSISAALQGIDLAIVGHIHKKLGTFVIKKGDGTLTTMIVPGSLTNTDAGMKSRHTEIDIPIIEIDDNGLVSVSYYTQSLHTELLTFYEKSITDDTREKLRSLIGNNKEALYDNLQTASFIGESDSFESFNQFIKRQGYTSSDRACIRSIITDPYDIDVLLSLHKEEEEL